MEEFVAATQAGQGVVYLRALLRGFGHPRTSKGGKATFSLEWEYSHFLTQKSLVRMPKGCKTLGQIFRTVVNTDTTITHGRTV